ncbi:MAG: ArsC family reductase [Burkholderiaceae bacterium]
MSAAKNDPITLFGISNCDQVRKARKLLKAQGVEYQFHDFRKDGLTEDLLDQWMRHVPWDALLNKRGRSWRQLSDSERSAITDQGSAQEAMLNEPTLIKRPVLTTGPHVLVGFSESVYLRTLGLQALPDGTESKEK